MMGWASHHIELLKQGLTVEFRPRGNSMTPRIKSHALCKVKPLTENNPIEVDDVVLCKVHGREYLHLVYAVKEEQVLIGNNHGHLNGWCRLSNVYGKLVSVGP